MQNGFLGNNASLMLDVVVCALVLVVPALLFSLYTVKIKRIEKFWLINSDIVFINHLIPLLYLESVDDYTKG